MTCCWFPLQMQFIQSEWERYQLVAAGLADPSYNAAQEAHDAMQRLLEADVVLTSYRVLQQEVHYSPNHSQERRLRHAKKYTVPESPLLAIRWGLRHL